MLRVWMNLHLLGRNSAFFDEAVFQFCEEKGIPELCGA
jgi:hypothetical protein